MSSYPPLDEARLLELLADQATGSLTPVDQAELCQLLEQAPAFDADVIERAAAAVELAMLAGGETAAGEYLLEEMPAALRRKIADEAPSYIRDNASARSTAALLAAAKAVSAPVLDRVLRDQAADVTTAGEIDVAAKPGPQKKPLPVRFWWALAAALLVASGLLIKLQSAMEDGPVSSYKQMIASDSADVIRADWVDPAAPEDKQSHGNVVWNNREQRGYMRFHGLAVNDPTREQYQLWIFDKTRDERYPVDGGVFDMAAAEQDPETGDTIVPIRATLPIRDLAMFAVTIEQPGGVVVSSRARLPLLAKIP